MTSYKSKNLTETNKIGQSIYAQLRWPSCVYLVGDLGAGKTALCQSIISAAGYSGVVTSPTYNLIQEYPVAAGIIYHLDLYRLEDPGELEYLGLSDLWSDTSLFLIEWPENGAGFLQAADLTIDISVVTEKTEESRIIKINGSF